MYTHGRANNILLLIAIDSTNLLLYVEVNLHGVLLVQLSDILLFYVLLVFLLY